MAQCIVNSCHSGHCACGKLLKGHRFEPQRSKRVSQQSLHQAMQHPNCMPELDWLKTSFCHRLNASKWHSALWIHATVDAVHVESFGKVTGSNLNSRKDSVNSHCIKPSAMRQKHTKTVRCQPNSLFGASTHASQTPSVDLNGLCTVERKIPMTNDRNTRSTTTANSRNTWSGQPVWPLTHARMRCALGGISLGRGSQGTSSLPVGSEEFLGIPKVPPSS